MTSLLVFHYLATGFAEGLDDLEHGVAFAGAQVEDVNSIPISQKKLLKRKIKFHSPLLL